MWSSFIGALACAAVLGAAADPKAQAHYAEASRLYVQGRYAEAAEELKRSLAIDPRQQRAARLLGITHQVLGDLEQAERAFVLATTLDPKDPEAWFFLGRVLYQANFFDRALPALEKAVALGPANVAAREHLALTLEAAGETGRALEEFQRALRHPAQRGKPSWTLHLTYGVLLAKVGRSEESETQLATARDLNPKHWQPWFELGKLHHEAGNLDAAATSLSEALRTGTANPEDAARVYRVLGRVYYAAGRDQEAAEAIRRAEQP